jgi:DNA-binding transcriptional ArsR family regulator
MLRIDLGADAVARTRFAISPIHALGQLLFQFSRHPDQLNRELRVTTLNAIKTEQLHLVARLLHGNREGYAPDFISPRPQEFECDLDSQLHRVATAAQHRIAYEMRAFVNCNAIWGLGAVETSPVVLRALDRGEAFLANAIAGQLEQLWRTVLQPMWPPIRAQMEADISHRSGAMARSGFAAMVNDVCPTLRWHRSGIDIDLRRGWRSDDFPEITDEVSADTAFLIPSAFSKTSMYSIDADNAPDKQPLAIIYPLLPTTAPGHEYGELIGESRSRILADLTTPRTTAEIAERLHLSRATVSYHLQVLLRSGLLSRSRQARQVYYERANLQRFLSSPP